MTQGVPERPANSRKMKWHDPPASVLEIDFTGLLMRIREGHPEGAMNRKQGRRFKAWVGDTWVIADFRMGRTRLYTERWGVAGRLDNAQMFHVTSFAGDVELCLREFTLMRVVI